MAQMPIQPPATSTTSGGPIPNSTPAAIPASNPTSIPSPLPQIKSIEMTLPNGAPIPARTSVIETPKVGKYTEYLSYCRSNNYDPGFEYSRYLNNDASIQDLKKMIDAKKYNDAEKFILTNRSQIGDQNYYQSLILVFGLKRNFIEAFKWIDRVSEEHKNDFSIKRLAAVVYELQNNFMEAKMMIQDLYKATKNTLALEDLCRLNVLDSQHRDAEISCETARRKMSKNYIIPIWLGISLREREMHKEAKAEFEKSLAIQPSEFALTCLAEVEYLRKNKLSAIDFFHKAIELNPISFRAQLGIAKLYYEQNKYEQALEHFILSCNLEFKNRMDFRKAYKDLTIQKSPFAEKYISAIQNCP